MPLVGQEKSDKVSVFDSPKERDRKLKRMREERATQEIESVRVVDPLDYGYPELTESQSVEPVLSEWDAYRVEGIVAIKEALVTARDALQVAEGWSKQISVVPGDTIPLIRELAHKSKLVVDELKDLR